MRVAVPDWQGRVSPVFDVAEHVRIVDFEREDEGSWCMESLGSTAPHDRARRLADLEVNVLVCGAISWPLEALLVTYDVRVIPLVCGDVADVVRAFRDGTLADGRFAMPGCCRRRRHVRYHHHGGGNAIREETS